jgi:hypothetical protein
MNGMVFGCIGPSWAMVCVFFFCIFFAESPDLALGKVFLFSLPRAPDLALGKGFFCIFFAESPRSSSRQRFFLFFCTFLRNFFAEGPQLGSRQRALCREAFAGSRQRNFFAKGYFWALGKEFNFFVFASIF